MAGEKGGSASDISLVKTVSCGFKISSKEYMSVRGSAGN